MHLQPIFRGNDFISRDGSQRAKTNAYIQRKDDGKDGNPADVGRDLFQRGLCLPSDIKMKDEEQEKIIQIVRACFD